MQRRFPQRLWSNPRAELSLEVWTTVGKLSSQLLQHEHRTIFNQWLNFDCTSLGLFCAPSPCGRHSIELEYVFVCECICCDFFGLSRLNGSLTGTSVMILECVQKHLPVSVHYYVVLRIPVGTAYTNLSCPIRLCIQQTKQFHAE